MHKELLDPLDVARNQLSRQMDPRELDVSVFCSWVACCLKVLFGSHKTEGIAFAQKQFTVCTVLLIYLRS